MFKRYILFWFKIIVIPYSLAWGTVPSDDQCMGVIGDVVRGHSPLERQSGKKEGSQVIGGVVSVPFPSELRIQIPSPSWLERLVANKPSKVRSAVTTMRNTNTSDPKHIQSISSLLEYSRENPELLTTDIFEVLLAYFVHFINRDLKVENEESIQYDAQTSQELLEILIIVYKRTKDYRIFKLFTHILENPSEILVFSRNPSKFAYIPFVNKIVQTLKDDVHKRPKLERSKILELFGKLLTELEDFYITSANAYINQSVFMEKAVENIVVNIARFVDQESNILHDLFARLSMLYKRKHSVRHDHALIEYRHVTIESIKKHLKPHHITSLMTTGDANILQTLVLFFKRDFHFPVEEIIQKIENFLLPLPSEFGVSQQITSMEILAARELAGETDPYVRTNFEGRAKWVQSPKIAPSRLTPQILEKIKRLSRQDSSPEVRGLAQKIIKAVESQNVQQGAD